jgi:hypothetical protein
VSQRSESQQSDSQGEDSNVHNQDLEAVKDLQSAKEKFLERQFDIVRGTLKILKSQNVKFEDFEIDPTYLEILGFPQ